MSDFSVASISPAEARPRASLQEIVSGMTSFLNRADAAYNDWGSNYTQPVENLLPIPSENRHMQNMLQAIKDPNSRSLMEHSLKMSDKLTVFNRVYLKDRMSSTISSGNMSIAIKAAGLTVQGLKQLISAT